LWDPGTQRDVSGEEQRNPVAEKEIKKALAPGRYRGREKVNG
jgi:hypothetical protein